MIIKLEMKLEPSLGPGSSVGEREKIGNETARDHERDHVLTEQEGGSYSRGGHQVQQRWICLSIPGKYNCSLFFLACGLNELEPDYVGHYCSLTTRRDSPRGVLPYKRLMGMCLWMGSHFHDWIDTHVTIKT